MKMPTPLLSPAENVPSPATVRWSLIVAVAIDMPRSLSMPFQRNRTRGWRARPWNDVIPVTAIFAALTGCAIGAAAALIDGIGCCGDHRPLAIYCSDQVKL